MGSKEKGKFARVNLISVPDESVKMPICQINPDEIKNAQQDDEVIRGILSFVEDGTYPDRDARKHMSKKEKALLNQLKKLEINDKGALIRKTKHQRCGL